MRNSVAITNTDHTAEGLKALARKCKDKNLSRRLRAIARVIEGEHTRAEIARQACVDRHTLCDWVNRYNARDADGRRSRTRSSAPRSAAGCRRVRRRACRPGPSVWSGSGSRRFSRWRCRWRRSAP